ncbi:MAG: hypothetical protein HY437_01215 [Candidatus Magasanikbacteria bacterium]|nr:hypothetical protein [Candidatus Magasanikbacteria bacterium]
MDRPRTIMARVITEDTPRGEWILHKNPLAQSWAGEMVEISVSSAGFNLRGEVMVEAKSSRDETRTVRIAVFTGLTRPDLELLYAAALDRRSDVPSALKRQMARAAGIKREDDIAPPA